MELDEIYIDAVRELLPVKCDSDDECRVISAERRGTVTVEDFETLRDSLEFKYRIDGEIAWLVNARTDLFMRMLKHDGEYVWQPPKMGTKADSRGWVGQLPYATFLNIPIIINENTQDIPPKGQSAVVAAIVNLNRVIDDGEMDAMVLLRVAAK